MIITTQECVINTDDISAVFIDYEEEEKGWCRWETATITIVFKSGAKHEIVFTDDEESAVDLFATLQKNIKKQRSKK